MKFIKFSGKNYYKAEDFVIKCIKFCKDHNMKLFYVLFLAIYKWMDDKHLKEIGISREILNSMIDELYRIMTTEE